MKQINRIFIMFAMTAVFNIPSTLKAQEERTNVTTEENIFKLSLGPSLVTSKILMPRTLQSTHRSQLSFLNIMQATTYYPYGGPWGTEEVMRKGEFISYYGLGLLRRIRI